MQTTLSDSLSLSPLSRSLSGSQHRGRPTRPAHASNAWLRRSGRSTVPGEACSQRVLPAHTTRSGRTQETVGIEEPRMEVCSQRVGCEQMRAARGSHASAEVGTEELLSLGVCQSRVRVGFAAPVSGRLEGRFCLVGQKLGEMGGFGGGWLEDPRQWLGIPSASLSRGSVGPARALRCALRRRGS